MVALNPPSNTSTIKSLNFTANGKKRGRKAKPHVCTWDGATIDGLYKQPDGRWRITATGERYTESDERLAVAKFREWERRQNAKRVSTITTEMPFDSKLVERLSLSSIDARMNLSVRLKSDGADDVAMDVSQIVQPCILWPWLRKMLIDCPEYVAQQVAIPQVARLADLEIPKEPIRLERFIQAFEQHAEVKPVSKRKARKVWDEMVKITGARTLADLNNERLLAYADQIKSRGYAAETVDNRFTRIKTVISFGRRRSMDPVQIRAALDRAAVLVPPKSQKKYKPSPITPEDFNALLVQAEGNDLMTAALLLSLNACLYASEAMSVQWDELDLTAGTYLSRRGKTGIIRAAVLWPRTITALKKLKVTPGATFKSCRGAAYHPNSYRDLFNDLKKLAGVKVEYNTIRDGAYTAACTAGVDFHLARIMAGHCAEGESDSYVMRNPRMVKPATDAVEKHYFGE